MQAITVGARNVEGVKYMIFSFFNVRSGTRSSRETSHSIALRKIWASFWCRWNGKKRKYYEFDNRSINGTIHFLINKIALSSTDSLSNFHAIVMFVLPDVGVKLSGISRHSTSGKNKRIIGATFRIYYQRTIENETSSAKRWNVNQARSTIFSISIFQMQLYVIENKLDERCLLH